MQLIFAFVFTCVKSRFSHAAAHIISKGKDKLCVYECVYVCMYSTIFIIN